MRAHAGRRWITTPRQVWRLWALAATATALAIGRYGPEAPSPPVPSARPPVNFELPSLPTASLEAEIGRAKAIATEPALWGATPASGEAPPPPPPDWHVAGVYQLADGNYRAIVVIEDGRTRPLELPVGKALPDGTTIESINDFQVCARDEAGAKPCHPVHLAPADRARVAKAASAKPDTAGRNAKPAAERSSGQAPKK